MTGLASVEQAVGVDAALVDALLRDIISERRARPVTHHAAYVELWDTLARLVEGGKKMRPALFLATYRGLTSQHRFVAPRDDRGAIDVACALELLHAAFVVHDDVIDADLVRRGEPNVAGRARLRARRLGASPAQAARLGDASGIIAGDLALSTALAVLATADVPDSARRALIRLAEDAIAETSAGEHADVWFSLGVEAADEDRVVRTIELKTSRYSFQAPLQAAGLLAGCSAHALELLSEVGRGLGLVYQLRDDVLGVFGSPEATGKSATADLREGTQTLLVVLARESEQWQRVSHLFGTLDLDEEGADRLRDAIRASGALEQVEQAIAAECQAVQLRITTGGLAPHLEAFLLDMLDKCSERDA